VKTKNDHAKKSYPDHVRYIDGLSKAVIAAADTVDARWRAVAAYEAAAILEIVRDPHGSLSHLMDGAVAFVRNLDFIKQQIQEGITLGNGQRATEADYDAAVSA